MARKKTAALKEECLAQLRAGLGVSKRDLNELVRRLELKINRLSNHPEIRRAQQLVSIVAAQPNYLETATQIEDLEILFRRDADILYHFKKPSNAVLYSPSHQTRLANVRASQRLSFRNPFPNRYERVDQVDVWSRTKSLTGSGGYRKHMSDFLFGENEIVQLEHECFRAAPGVLKERNRIWFYARFPRAIGWSSKDKRKQRGETAYIRVQADKVPRYSGSGYFVELHGYPVSQQEAETSGLEGMDLNFPYGWSLT